MESERFSALLKSRNFMLTRNGCVLPIILCVLSPIALAQKKKSMVMTGSAAKPSQPVNVKVAPDLAQRLAKFRSVEMPLPRIGLTATERKMVDKLVEACHYLEGIFWRQMDPDALSLYQSLAGSTNARDVQLRRYLWINASRLHLIDNTSTYVGKDPMPPGRGFYPQGLTRAQIEKYVTEHPEKRAEIYNPFTVARRNGQQLEGLPYHQAYRSLLEAAANALREAAKLSSDSAFASFLRLRADALLTD